MFRRKKQIKQKVCICLKRTGFDATNESGMSPEINLSVKATSKRWRKEGVEGRSLHWLHFPS